MGAEGREEVLLDLEQHRERWLWPSARDRGWNSVQWLGAGASEQGMWPGAPWEGAGRRMASNLAFVMFSGRSNRLSLRSTPMPQALSCGQSYT